MRTVSLLGMLLLSFLVRAQERNAPVFRFNHLAISVKDPDRSVEFYKTVLHLDEITNKSRVEGIRWLSLGEGKELHLISVMKEPVVLNKGVHLALTTHTFDAFVQSLEERKIPYSDWPGAPGKINVRADGIKQVYFQDPDGYWIEVNSVGE